MNETPMSQSAFWADLTRDLVDLEFLRSYVAATQEIAAVDSARNGSGR